MAGASLAWGRNLPLPQKESPCHHLILLCFTNELFLLREFDFSDLLSALPRPCGQGRCNVSELREIILEFLAGSRTGLRCRNDVVVPTLALEGEPKARGEISPCDVESFPSSPEAGRKCGRLRLLQNTRTKIHFQLSRITDACRRVVDNQCRSYITLIGPVRREPIGLRYVEERQRKISTNLKIDKLTLCAEGYPREERISCEGHDGLVVRPLASHLGKPGSIPGGGSSLIFTWLAGILGDLPFPPPLHSGDDPFSPHFILVGFRELAVKSSPNHSSPIISCSNRGMKFYQKFCNVVP
ncbi:hypothetical protein PR048_031600 [Dryococelus australis]|uniref:Uncharacterized protein n=1 Tax=Dryococelus australis TaxID=614101 RepID=A0ABQ9G5R1_9NEOP|nr:hypothetical protein PR048_031600 [Dryococelus australis]